MIPQFRERNHPFAHCQRNWPKKESEMSSSRATESDAPISGGGGGAATSIVTNSPTKDEAVDSSPYQLGELVIAYHGPCLYDAKVCLLSVLLLYTGTLKLNYTGCQF